MYYLFPISLILQVFSFTREIYPLEHSVARFLFHRTRATSLIYWTKLINCCFFLWEQKWLYIFVYLIFYHELDNLRANVLIPPKRFFLLLFMVLNHSILRLTARPYLQMSRTFCKENRYGKGYTVVMIKFHKRNAHWRKTTIKTIGTWQIRSQPYFEEFSRW